MSIRPASGNATTRLVRISNKRIDAIEQKRNALRQIAGLPLVRIESYWKPISYRIKITTAIAMPPSV